MTAIQTVLFDLDGTLADTAPDLGGALNELLRTHGLPEKNLADIRPAAGHGSAALIRLGAGIAPDHPDFAQWQQDYLAAYAGRCARDSVLFDGIARLLAELHHRSLKWGIVTNKSRAFTERLLPALGFPVPPAAVVCGDTCAEAKPSPQPLLHAARQTGTPPAQCLYLGDAERDMQAARRAGMTAVLARWGYIADTDDTAAWLCDAVIGTPAELLSLLDSF